VHKHQQTSFFWWRGLFLSQFTVRDYIFNPLPPSDAVRKQKKNILEDLFSSVLSKFQKYHPSGNLKFNYLGILQSLKLPILIEEILSISLKPSFTSNPLGCYGLKFTDRLIEW